MRDLTQGAVAYEANQLRVGKVLDTEDYSFLLGAYLPHSCQEWVVGGVREIDLLIEDLKKAKEELLKGETK